MSLEVYDLLDLARCAEELERSAVESRPLAWTRWTPAVERWFSDPSRWRCLLGGNGTGKSRGGAAELVWRATGTHPYRATHKPPVKMGVYGYSHSALEAIMGETWGFTAGTGLHPRCGYDPGRGITGKPPRLLWENGSTLLFLTYSQSSQGYAGKTMHFQLLDEPCPASKWGEIRGRTRGVQGEIALNLTPTPESPEQDWLAEKCESGEISLTVSPLCTDPEDRSTLIMDAVTPRGGRPWTPEPDLWGMIRSWLPAERRMRCGLSWHMVASGRQLDAFDPLRHVYRPDRGPTGDVTGGLSTDHGLDPGRQASVLGCTDGYRVWILGAYRPRTRTSSKEDARGIVDLLSTVGWTPRTRLIWVGDRSAESQKWAVRKSNGDLAHDIADLVRQPRDTLCDGEGLFIRVPPKGRGSVWRGLKIINGLLREDRLLFHPSCRSADIKHPGLIECIEGWEGDPKDPRKDLLDALRYLVEELIDRSALSPPSQLYVR